jgi:hypothetical protein
MPLPKPGLAAPPPRCPRWRGLGSENRALGSTPDPVPGTPSRMRSILLRDGTLLVPMRAEADDGTVGDGMVPLDPSSPRYAAELARAIPEGTDPILAELAEPLLDESPEGDDLDR